MVLDIQQLFTVTKSKFLVELDTIPMEFVKGFHIHAKTSGAFHARIRFRGLRCFHEFGELGRMLS